MNDIFDIAELLRSWNNIEIYTHIHPDGDALGSSSALAAALVKLGKNVRVTVNDTLPKNFAYIHNVVYPEFEAEHIVTVDAASMTLLGKFPENKKIDLAIDHHLKNTVCAERLYCDPERGACGEIIFELIEALGVEPDLYIAECLYTAIATDTGCFRFSNTTSRTFEIASKLCRYTENGNFGYLNTPLFTTKSPKLLALESEIFTNLTYYFSGKAAVSVVTDELFKRLGIEENDAAGIEQLAKIPEGVLLGITLKERLGGFKVSMRSDDSVDAAKICADFGGGGHHSAAGCFIAGSRNEVVRKLICYLEERDVL